MENVSYKLDNFEGPLDLLLHLIEKNKMDIFDIPIVELTDQYLLYIENITSTEDYLDKTSDFLVMAATLLEIKSKFLLPLTKNKEEEQDPREELVLKLLEYKKYKDLGNKLSDYEDNAPEYMLKPPTIPKEVATFIPKIDYDELLSGIDMAKLTEVFNDVIRRKQDSVDQTRAGFGTIAKEKVPLKNVIIDVVRYSNEHKKYSFRNLLMEQTSKTYVIVTFLAVLELIKVGRIKVVQDNACGEIEIETVEGATGFVDLANLEDG